MLALLKEVWLTAKKALTTLSGVLISFTLQRPKKAKKLVLSYLPQQDLNGYSKPWLGGNGKNQVDVNALVAAGASVSVSGGIATLTAINSSTYRDAYYDLPLSLLGQQITASAIATPSSTNTPGLYIRYENSEQISK